MSEAPQRVRRRRTLRVSAALVVAHVLFARGLVLWDPGAALAAGPAKGLCAMAALGVFYMLRAVVLLVVPPIVSIAVVGAIRVRCGCDAESRHASLGHGAGSKSPNRPASSRTCASFAPPAKMTADAALQSHRTTTASRM